MKKSVVCAIIMGCTFLSIAMIGCNESEKDSEMAVLREYMRNEISTYDTERLREIMSDSRWYESDEEVQFVEPFVFELDEMKYQIDYYTDYVDGEAVLKPIRYGKIDGDYSGVLDTDDRSLMLDLRRLVFLWRDIPYSYEYCLEHFANKSSVATLQLRDSDDAKVYTFSEEDTSRLRSLLKLENGWYNVGSCGHKGEYMLTLDNINYYYHMNDEAHPIMYGNTDGSSVYYSNGIENINKEIDLEVRSMIEDAVSYLE